MIAKVAVASSTRQNAMTFSVGEMPPRVSVASVSRSLCGKADRMERGPECPEGEAASDMPHFVVDRVRGIAATRHPANTHETENQQVCPTATAPPSSTSRCLPTI